MKNSTVIIILVLLILVSGLSGYFIRAHFEKSPITPTPITISVNDTAKERFYTMRLALKDHINDSLKAALLKKVYYPKIIFVTKQDSSKHQNIDSIGLVNCTESFRQSIDIINRQDSLNDMHVKREKFLTTHLDTCAENLNRAIAQKQQSDATINNNDKKLKRWQGIGIGAAIVAVIASLFKLL